MPNENEVFGQSERQKEKLRNLVDWGYEIGSNTMTNLDLSAATEDSIRNELASSQLTLKILIGSDYAVSSLAVPYGRFPKITSLLASGTWEDSDKKTYLQYTAAGRPRQDTLARRPSRRNFNPMHIPRIVSAGENLSVAIDELKRNALLMYISDGDPTTVSAPYALSPSLGEPRNDLGRPVVRY